VTTTQRPTIVALFTSEEQAQQAVNALRQAGINDDQISFSGHETQGGGFLAGLKSFFTGDSTATGSSGSAYDDLSGMGFQEPEARYFQREYENGRSVVAVRGASDTQRVTSILAQYGGYGPSRDTARTTGYGADAERTATDMDEGQRMQLREEQLRVNKQSVETGAASLHKEVSSQQQNIDVPVTREEVVVERRPGSGQPSDTPIGEGETYRVPVREEQVSVQKQPVVREEVSLGKRQVQDTQRVSDTVRREEARVEREGDTNIQGDDTTGA